MQEVRLVMKQGTRALVEWYSREDDNYYRSIVPASSVVKSRDRLICDVADLGIPYGVLWSDLPISTVFDSALFEKEMRRVGIWTGEDIESNPQVVVQCLQKSLNVGLQQVRLFAKNYQGQSYGADDGGSVDNE